MDAKFTLKVKNLKNITLFNPELTPDKSSSEDGSVVVEINGDKLIYKIYSFRYLLIGSSVIENTPSDTNISIILPLKKLKDIIDKYQEDSDIIFKVKDDNINIEAIGVKYKFKSIQDEEWMKNVKEIEKDDGDSDEYIIPKSKFMKGLNKIRVAMGDDQVRYYLNGSYIEILYNENEKVSDIFFVATSGYMLGTFGNKLDGYNVVKKAIIPKKVIPELIKVIDKSDNSVKVSISKGKMLVKSDNGSLEMLLRLIEAEFPDYNKVIPQDNNNFVTLDIDLFKDMLSKISILVNGCKIREVKLSSVSDILSLEVMNDLGEIANTDFSIAGHDKDLSTKLNIDYISSIVSQFDGKDMIIKFNDGNNPLTIKQTNNDDLLFVLMPIRM
ncbi:MAG: DNA polymerase III subunit beta [Rickettsiales bacterium]|jgi:DNA polymerase-3 subunit beta|nr:DNA polymerase III subunit beta [Rickettsiales bacterium]